MAKSCLIQEWLKADGQIEIDWHPDTERYYAAFNKDMPPFDFDACGTGETPMEALESLIEDVNELRES